MPPPRRRAGHLAWLAVSSSLLALVALGRPPVAEAARVRVVACPTEYGIVGPTKRLPASVATRLGAGQAAGLELYGNNVLLVLAPAAWHCSGLVGADGSAGMTVTHGARTVAVQAVGYTSSVGAGQACPLFADADALSPVPCEQHHPTGESITRINATTIAFEDPPHVHGTGEPSGGALPANGVMLYSPSGRHGFFFEETCVLPAGDARLCTTILDDGIRRAPR
jgi:hypothetical protein